MMRARVLLDLSTYRPGRTGGADRVVSELLPRLHRLADYEWCLVCHRDAGDTLAALGFDAAMLFPVPDQATGIGAKRHVRFAAKNWRPDVIMAPLTQSPLVRDVPEVLTIQDLAPLAYLRKPLRGELRGGDRASMALRLLRLARGARAATSIVAHCSSVADELLYLGVPADRVTVVRLGGDFATPSTCVPQNRGGAGRVCVVSSDRPHKNLALVNMVAREPEMVRLGAKLLVVGKEGDARIVRPASNVEVIRALSDEDLYRVLSTCDVLLAPSRYEGFGLPVVEAMHAEVPVVASAIRPHEELLGGTRWLFHPDDAAKAAADVVRLCRDRDLARKYGRDLHARARALFTWDEAAKGYAAVLQDAVQDLV